jgi:hypothetical protein
MDESRFRLRKKGVQEPAIITHDKRGLAVNIRSRQPAQRSAAIIVRSP